MADQSEVNELYIKQNLSSNMKLNEKFKCRNVCASLKCYIQDTESNIRECTL